MSIFWTLSKRGEGSTGIQKFGGIYVFLYFDPLLGIKWGGDGGFANKFKQKAPNTGGQIET